MAQVIGTVGEINGKFYVKDLEGNIREVKSSDPLYEGETVIPDPSNATDATIVVNPTNNTTPLVIDSTSEQILDVAFVNEGLNNSALNFNSEVLDDTPTTTKFAQLDGAQTDVNSDLRQRKFGGDDSDYGKENEQTEENAKFIAKHFSQD